MKFATNSSLKKKNFFEKYVSQFCITVYFDYSINLKYKIQNIKCQMS